MFRFYSGEVVTTPTVLVLGAGASYPYGFPLAPELKRLVCEAFARPDSPGSLYFDGQSESDFTAGHFVEFCKAFRHSGQASVDAFLEHRGEFREIGRLAIAFCLMPFENEESLFAFEGMRGGDWYQYLFSRLNGPFEDFKNNRLSIVTFNYDRSLEHYLLTALRHSHGRQFDECCALLDHLPIVHAYGQLSVQPYPLRQSHAYRPDKTNFTTVSAAAHGIRIIHDSLEKEPQIAKARSLIADAERICFLGLSFHPTNLSRLGIQNERGGKTMYGTARGLIGQELQAVSRQIGQIKLEALDNLEMLRHYAILS